MCVCVCVCVCVWKPFLLTIAFGIQKMSVSFLLLRIYNILYIPR